MIPPKDLKERIKIKSKQLGFTLAGVTTPEPPLHLSVFEDWLKQGRHASMGYLAEGRAHARRADPKLILPGCKSILVLALPYSSPMPQPVSNQRSTPKKKIPAQERMGKERGRGRVAAYAWGADYHLILPERLQALTAFIERQMGQPVAHRFYTDTGPILERDLAQRAGLGWIGKNTCLINPGQGSYFLLAEIFLDLELEPDLPFKTDHCGTCIRCIEACPTDCILPDRTIDAGRCISYLTIELKEDISPELRPLTGDWVFGCDICQMVCPWNRFATAEGDPAFQPAEGASSPQLIRELELTPKEFNRKFKSSPIRRAKRRGYLRNVAVAIGNEGKPEDMPDLEKALNDVEPMVREHAAWAIQSISDQNLKPDDKFR
jgi:epoxyqueuosine reductase